MIMDCNTLMQQGPNQCSFWTFLPHILEKSIPRCFKTRLRSACQKHCTAVEGFEMVVSEDNRSTLKPPTTQQNWFRSTYVVIRPFMGLTSAKALLDIQVFRHRKRYDSRTRGQSL
jgi:hypothetical protein